MSLPNGADAHRRPTLFLNGKFYAGALNGVRRVSDRLVRELDRIAQDGGAPASWDMRLLLPTRAHQVPELSQIRSHPQSLGHTQFWEQAMLPFVARGGTLVSLANLGPGHHARKVTMVHDAQFRLSPESYPLKLRLGYRLLVPRGAQSSQLVLTVSDYARDSLATFGISDPDRTRVLYNGADHILDAPPDPAVLAEQGLRPGSFCVVFGSTWHYKNLRVVLEAFHAKSLQDLALVVIGSSRDQMERAGLVPPPDTRFVSNVTDPRLRALLEAAHCLLCPSRTEGFGLPPVEAMFCGCPVVAAPAGAIPEVCRDAICFAGVDSPLEWVDQIMALRGHRLRDAKIALGRARSAHFSWRAAGIRFVELLRPIVEGSAPGDPAKAPAPTAPPQAH